MINPDFLAKVATDALLQEVNLAPKPGLVDPISVGAHKDMTKETFYQSIEALRPYLLAYAEAGSRHNGSPLDLFNELRALGKQAENAMMTATNNIITDFTQKEKENVLTFDQIKEMKKAGLTFESHTVNHPDLANSSLETQKNELVASKRLLDKVLDQNTSVIVYPSGRYSQVTIDQAKKADYKLGLTTKNGLASSADGLYALKRVRILPTTTGEDLLAMIQE